MPTMPGRSRMINIRIAGKAAQMNTTAAGGRITAIHQIHAGDPFISVRIHTHCAQIVARQLSNYSNEKNNLQTPI